MRYLLANQVAQSASEIKAELAACRQLRHLTDDHRARAIKDTYYWIAECWFGREATKNPEGICAKCGGPKSKGAVGLCFRCYAVKGVDERDLWVQDVFSTAVEIYGFQCDACGSNYKPDNSDDCRTAAAAMLDNINGLVRPVICYSCNSDFKSFASRKFGKGSWRPLHDRDRAWEKIALAWLAQKVKVLAERKAGAVQ